MEVNDIVVFRRYMIAEGGGYGVPRRIISYAVRHRTVLYSVRVRVRVRGPLIAAPGLPVCTLSVTAHTLYRHTV